MQFIDLAAQYAIIEKKVEARIKDVFNHGRYIMGPEINELEIKLAEYVGVKHCISCSSGTDALLIPLMAQGIGKGDAVITTPFTYIATAEVISLLGATPVFCDIYPDTFNINPDGLQNAYNIALHKNLKPKGIIPVDLFGLPANYSLIEKFAKDNNLFVLEDAAQGFGGSINGIKAGAFGHAAATSFFPSKPLGCYGDGGAIFTNDDQLSKKMKSIRIHGAGKDKYDNIYIGINGRLDTLQAAILLEKLAIFDVELKKRNQIASYYTDNLDTNFKSPFISSEYISSWAQYSILAETNGHRNRIIKKLKKKNIPAMVYYRIPLHLQKVFKSLGYIKGEFPVAERISNRIFSIPMHPYIGKNIQNRILDVLRID
ncbi:MAG: aminotransferase DegT [Candidatus Marinimicrobia bacterium]|nr:aminotransferase DegT [Candidatus Neomarinimicrobiota bacterium]|tara:strand:- start:28685 stop:29800 length:1116 start_codon:yes stop_codon:yes gene_type:complete